MNGPERQENKLGGDFSGLNIRDCFKPLDVKCQNIHYSRGHTSVTVGRSIRLHVRHSEIDKKFL